MPGFNCIVALIVGGLAGMVAGRVIRGKGYGIPGNIVLGWIGSIVGSMAFGLLGFGSRGLFGQFLVATVGAVLFIVLIRIFMDSEFAS
ncbi:MAG: hypothetical protein Kow0077_26930 [Anaerolineae bacterium]